MNAATRPVQHASMMLTALVKITVHLDPASTDLGVIGDIEDNNNKWKLKICFQCVKICCVRILNIYYLYVYS